MEIPMIRDHILASLAAAIAIGALPSAQAADTCEALYQAGIKTVQTPHHVYTTPTTHDGKAVAGEAIYAGGVEYVQLRGKWMRSPMTQQAMLEAAQEKMKTHPDTCTLIGDQYIGGRAVTAYKVHDNEYGIDSEVRILKSSGLVQGESTRSPDGAVRETRYEYGNVGAPAGVQ
jgi:hypothetical protein